MGLEGFRKRIKIHVIALIAAIGVLMGCQRPQMEIDAFCWLNEMGNYSIRWEVSKEMNGKVEVYRSFRPDSFPSTPIQVVPLDEGMLDVIDRDSYKRSYFRLVFPNGQRVVVADNDLKMPRIQNFCDLGGVVFNRDFRVSYGKLYRSGTVDSISCNATDRFSRLGIKTLIDLRPESFIFGTPQADDLRLQRVNHPIELADADSILQAITRDDCKRGDVILFMQKSYHEALVKSAAQIKSVFELLADETNYPVILACVHGKDRSSIVTTLLYDYIGIGRWYIEQDYMQEREVLSLPHYQAWASRLTESGQEALTALLVPQLAVVRDLLKWIDLEFGSSYGYLHDYLGIEASTLERVKNNLTCQN